MGTGEYVSVSTQRDSEKSLLGLEARELEQMPETEERELARMYEDKGLSRETAETVARELTAHDPLRAHADIEFGIDPDNLTNPWHAAWASMLAFTIGALLPLLGRGVRRPTGRACSSPCSASWRRSPSPGS